MLRTLILLLLTVTLAWSCNLSAKPTKAPGAPKDQQAPEYTQPQDPQPPKYPQVPEDTQPPKYPQAPSSGSPDSSVDGARADILVGEVEFYDIMCGISISRLRRSPPNPIDVYRPTHSLLVFRGHVFEWGVAPLSFRFRNRGSMDRDPDSKCISWDNAPRGSSTCTLEQAQHWADNYHSTYGTYNLLLNNCHMFVTELISYLETGCN